MANYVNNPDFLNALSEYRLKVHAAKANGTDVPIVSRYIGECILKIATNLAHKPNFNGYSYKEEMISDGIENCLQYINNFDPVKSNNPFAYFTQIIYYAFLRRIAKEKKQSYIKGQLMKEIPFDTFELQGQDDSSDFKNSYVDYMQVNGTYDTFIDRKAAKRKAAKQAAAPAETKNALDEFLSEEEK